MIKGCYEYKTKDYITPKNLTPNMCENRIQGSPHQHLSGCLCLHTHPHTHTNTHTESCKASAAAWQVVVWNLSSWSDRSFTRIGERERQGGWEDEVCGSLFLSARCTSRKHTLTNMSHMHELFVCLHNAHTDTPSSPAHTHMNTHNKVIYRDRVFFSINEKQQQQKRNDFGESKPNKNTNQITSHLLIS